MNNKRYLFGIISSIIGLSSPLFAADLTFSQTLLQAGINTTTLAQQSSVSRFEMAKLLNAIMCEDCITAAPRMRQTYSLEFRQTFSQLPNKDFQDITF
jgi:hypothetical protein